MADIFEIVGRVSLDGIDRAERELNSFTDTGEKSSSKLSKFGSVAKSIGKGLLIGTGAVVTGAVGLVKQVSSSYGALQQSIGGVETLFGESAKKVIDNANKAYTTAGMSANDYMQQVTSFSASLLQSLGGDTEKAANSADMAIRDMSDNANKMGTSMEMITNAYQGFAKQNYTMLDNLKLGYGGTKTEMERLIKDASKMTDVQKELGIAVDGTDMSFGNIVNAIHVVQAEMGLLGTTSDEAAGTIEGSFNSLSAIWANFIAGLGNPAADMKGIIESLAIAIKGAIDNVVPVVDNMVKVLPTVVGSLVDAVKTMLPTLIETFTSMIEQIINAIIELLPTAIPLLVDCFLTVAESLIKALPQIVDALILLISELITKLSEMLPSLIPTIIDGMLQIANSIVTNAPVLLDAILNLVNGLAEAFTEALPQLIEALPPIINDIVTFLIGAIPQLIDAGVQLFMGLVEALPEIITALVAALPQIISSIVDGLISNLPTLIQGVIQLVMGLVGALPEIISALVEAAPTIISLIVEGLVASLPDLIAGAIQLVIGLVGALPEILVGLVTGLPKALEAVWDGVKKGASKIVDWFGSNFSDAKEKAVAAWDNAKEKFGKAWDKVKSAFSESEVGKFFTERFKEGKENAVKAWDTAKSAFSKVWGGIKTAFNGVGNWFKDRFNEGKNNAVTAWNTAKSAFSTVRNGINGVFSNVGSWFGERFAEGKNNAVNAFSNIKSKFTEIKEKVASAFSDIKERISAPFEKARDAVKSVVDKIKGFFNFKISFPHIPLPHFKVSPPGWSVGDLLKGKIPSLGIDWYAKAMAKPMLLTKPTAFGYDEESGTVRAGGEAGNEVVSGASTLMNMISNAVSMENNPVVYCLQQLIQVVGDFFPQLITAIGKVPDIQVDKTIENVVTEDPVQKYQFEFNNQFNILNDSVERLIGLIGEYLPDIASGIDREIVLDSGAMVVGMTRKIDRELGKIKSSKGRGNV